MPSPRRIAARVTRPARSRRRTWSRALRRPQPITSCSASNGVAPTLAIHASACIDFGPGATHAPLIAAACLCPARWRGACARSSPRSRKRSPRADRRTLACPRTLPAPCALAWLSALSRPQHAKRAPIANAITCALRAHPPRRSPLLRASSWLLLLLLFPLFPTLITAADADCCCRPRVPPADAQPPPRPLRPPELQIPSKTWRAGGRKGRRGIWRAFAGGTRGRPVTEGDRFSDRFGDRFRTPRRSTPPPCGTVRIRRRRR